MPFDSSTPEGKEKIVDAVQELWGTLEVLSTATPFTAMDIMAILWTTTYLYEQQLVKHEVLSVEALRLVKQEHLDSHYPIDNLDNTTWQ